MEISLKKDFNLEKVDEILNKPGKTIIKIRVTDGDTKYVFSLKNKRFVDKNQLNLLKTQGITTNIS